MDNIKVFVECSDTFRKIKGIVLHRDSDKLKVKLPTGCVLDLMKHPRYSKYSFNIGTVEFYTDGKEVI